MLKRYFVDGGDWNRFNKIAMVITLVFTLVACFCLGLYVFNPAFDSSTSQYEMLAIVSLLILVFWRITPPFQG